MNMMKTGILMILLTGLLLLVGFLLGGPGGLVIALVLSLVMNFAMYWWSDSIILKMTKAKAVSENDDKELHRIVEEQATLARIPRPRVYIIENDSPNAFATGRSPKHAAVAVTTGIRRLLSREELGGVIAHELAHVGNRDTLIMTIAAAIAGAIAYLAMMAQWSLLLGGGRNRNGGSQAGALIGVISLVVIAVVMPLAATIIRMAISRAREYEADATGARTSGRAWALADALEKLDAGVARRPMKVSEAASHLFIVNPLKGGVAGLFSTHPPIEERVRRLRNTRVL